MRPLAGCHSPMRCNACRFSSNRSCSGLVSFVGRARYPVSLTIRPRRTTFWSRSSTNRVMSFGEGIVAACRYPRIPAAKTAATSTIRPKRVRWRSKKAASKPATKQHKAVTGQLVSDPIQIPEAYVTTSPVSGRFICQVSELLLSAIFRPKQGTAAPAGEAGGKESTGKLS